MNKQCYRIIFNRERGMLMVVSDIAKSYGGAVSSGAGVDSQPVSRSLLARLRPLSFFTSLMLGAVMLVTPAQANIVADANAPGNQQPQIIASSNGTPQVNIQAPSAGGVSRNQYSQFDVNQKGVILNNSRNNVNTELGGFIAGNNNLAGGEARIILNEVNSRNPSQLNGYIEVAGQKAQVVIANPSGITCDGCGFINADRATLTTGKAELNNGHLQGYRVDKGQIKITGKGLDTSRQDYTELISRSVEVNSGIWANDVKVVTGRNQVSRDLTSVQALADDGSDKPTLAIDVAELGGMYAGKIHLIGTEQGVGVHNAGQLGASAGSVVVSAEGKIVNTGRIQAQQDIQLAHRGDINNSGTLHANNSVKLTSQDKILNSGTVYAANAIVLEGQNQITNRGKVQAGRDIELTSGGQITNTDTIYAGGNAKLTAASVSNQGTLAAKNNLLIQANQLATSTNSLTVAGLNDAGYIQGQGSLQLDIGDGIIDGSLLAASNLQINSHSLRINQTGEVIGHNTTLNASDTLTHYGLIDGGVTRINAGTLDNLNTGRIYGDQLAIQAQTLNNLAGATLGGRYHISLGVGTLDNRGHSLIYSGGSLAIGGMLNESNMASGRAGTINNHSSIIEADGDARIVVGTLNNVNDNFVTEVREVSRENFHEFRVSGSIHKWDISQVNFFHNQTLHINTPTEQDKDVFDEYKYERVISENVIVETDPAKLLAGGNLIIDADTVLNDKSQIAAGQTLQIIANVLNNVEVPGLRFINDIGTLDKWWVIRRSGSDDQGHSVATYRPATVIQEIVLKPSTLEENTLINGSGADIAVTDNNDRVNLPDSSLYQIHPGASALYLVESDPRFTQYKKWLGSDYMTAMMKSDPNSVMKRLGDGYYEQKLIREQIIDLTGQRYLDGFANDEEQYKALMTAGVEFAGQYGLSIGVALTSEQISQLTSDIVWLVSKSVTLANGEVETVLVPQVYARPGSTSLNGSGALISGQQTGLQLAGDLTNSGRIVGSDKLTVIADNLNNLSGQISGNDVQLVARQDINNIGGHIQAGDSLLLQAGNDINIRSTTSSNENKETRTELVGDARKGGLGVTTREVSSSSSSNTSILGVGSISVQNDNSQLTLSAGRDINVQAGQITNSGEDSQTTLAAGRDINLTTVKTAKSESVRFDKDNHYTLSSTQDVGSQIVSNGNVTLSAQNDIIATAANVDAAQHLSVNAGNNLTIQSGTETVNLDDNHKASGTSGGIAKVTTETHVTVDNRTAIGSSFSGGSVDLTAGNNIQITGSQVAGSGEVNLTAGNDITIEAAEESRYRQSQTITTKSGLMSSGGIGFTVGQIDENLKQTDTERSYLGSMVGSTDGSVTLKAGQDLTVKGSDVIAKQDITATAQNITLESVDAETRYKEEYRRQQTGLTLAITGTASDVYEAAKAVQNAQERGNDKTTALQSIKAGLTMIQAMQDMELTNKEGDKEASIGIKASVGTQITERTVEQEQHTAIGSGLSAGNNISLTATGDKEGNGGDINIKGSEIKAGNDITLDANNDLNMIASVNTQNSDRKETNYGGSVGIGFSFGGDESGFRVSGSANFSSERENANGSAWSESIVDAGNKLTVKTGNDANLIGAQLKGDTVVANIGNNLNIQSLQDTDNFEYEKLSIAVDGSYGTGASANLNLSMTTMESNWASVTDQSGIFAGKGGYDIFVGNNTDLKGAVIASTADDKKLNNLDTGTLSFSDITNKADYKVEHVAISVGTGGMTPPTLYQDKDSDSSTTHSAVEQGNITIRDKDGQKQDLETLSRDTENANNVLGTIFDKQEHLDKIEQIGLVKDITQQAIKVAENNDKLKAQRDVEKTKYPEATDIKARRDELLEKNKDNPDYKLPSDDAIKNELFSAKVDSVYNDKYKTTGMGSDTNKAIGAVGSVLAGVLTGDITGGLAGAGAPYIAEKIKEATTTIGPDGKPQVDKTANTLAHILLGAVTAELQGGSAVAGGIGAGSGELAADFIYEQFYSTDKEGNRVELKDLTDAQKEEISALASIASGLAVASTGGGSYDIVTGVQTGKTSIENNRLNTDKENEIIANLAKEGHDKEKLDAAACALVKCYAQYAIGSEEYNKNLALAKQGEQYQDEQALLKNAELITSYYKDPLYWNQVPEEIKLKYQGFEYSVHDQIADGMASSEAWKIGYIADKLGVDPGVVKLTQDGFSLIGQGAGVYFAGQVVKPGGVMADKPLNSGKDKNGYLTEPKEGGVLNIGAGNKPTEGAYNISHPDYPMAPGVNPGNANDLSKIPTGSQNKIIMENPYGYEPLNKEVIRVLAPNGTIIIKGSGTNGTLKNIEAEAAKNGLVLVSKKDIPNTGYAQSNGQPIRGDVVIEYVFERK